MKISVEFKYIFLALGDRVNHEWVIRGTYTRIEHPCYDLEGDLSNMPDVEEYFTLLSINDFTLGFDSGEINPRVLPRFHLKEIARLGLWEGLAQIEKRNEQRKGSAAPVGVNL